MQQIPPLIGTDWLELHLHEPNTRVVECTVLSYNNVSNTIMLSTSGQPVMTLLSIGDYGLCHSMYFHASRPGRCVNVRRFDVGMNF